MMAIKANSVLMSVCGTSQGPFIVKVREEGGGKRIMITWTDTKAKQYLLHDRKTKESCVELAGLGTFRMHTD